VVGVVERTAPDEVVSRFRVDPDRAGDSNVDLRSCADVDRAEEANVRHARGITRLHVVPAAGKASEDAEFRAVPRTIERVQAREAQVDLERVISQSSARNGTTGISVAGDCTSKPAERRKRGLPSIMWVTSAYPLSCMSAVENVLRKSLETVGAMPSVRSHRGLRIRV